MSEVLLKQLGELARPLSPEEKLALIGELVEQMQGKPQPPKPSTRPVRGSLAHLGPSPSAEEIDEARREVWASFPSDPS